LKDLIGRVREKLGPASETEQTPSQKKQAELFSYLLNLAGNLPPSRNEEFRRSDARIQMAHLQARLSGRPSLRDRASTVDVAGGRTPDGAASAGGTVSSGARSGTARPHPTADRSSVGSALSYLASLSKNLPDRDLGTQLADRAERVSSKLRAAGRST
jgi:hypothetical protein